MAGPFTFICALSCALAWHGVAAAQEGEPAPEPVAETLGVPLPNAVIISPAAPHRPVELRMREYDDGVGTDEVPWNSVRRDVHYLPVGRIHFGVQLRIAALVGGDSPLSTGPLAELGGILDVRWRTRSPWRFRLVVAVSVQPSYEEIQAAGTIEQSSPLAMRARLFPIGVDFGQRVTLRLGIDLGAQYASLPTGSTWMPLFAALGEVAVRFYDGRLEVAASGGMQHTGVGAASRGGDGGESRPQAVLGGSVAYVLP